MDIFDQQGRPRGNSYFSKLQTRCFPVVCKLFCALHYGTKQINSSYCVLFWSMKFNKLKK